MYSKEWIDLQGYWIGMETNINEQNKNYSHEKSTTQSTPDFHSEELYNTYLHQ
jgi:hypothetical protein